MSSLSFLLPNYTLSQSFQLHSGAVRCISSSEDILVTGSYDSTLYLYKCTEGIYEPMIPLLFHSEPVYSCLISPDATLCFSGDKSGKIYSYNLTESCSQKLFEHTKSVSSLDIQGKTLLSGSWDTTAKLWDLNTGVCTATLDSQKHTHAVCIKSIPNMLVTGSQNGNLNFWDCSGNFIRSIKAHDDIIKKIEYNEDIGIITCSNDNTVKVISRDGRIMNTFLGHQGYVFTCGSIGLDVISGSDDKCVKIWRDGTCADSIHHPETVWDLATNYNGDIITAGGDYFTRIFTLNKSRAAPEAELKKYNDICIQKETASSEVDISKYPEISELKTRVGKSEGDIQLFRNGNIGEAYMWHSVGLFWEKIGEVIGAPDAGVSMGMGPMKKYYEGDRFFPSGEYEYIFDVELGDGIMKKLPYNNNQNPLESAEKFIAREGMRKDSIQQITKFLNDNAKPSFNAAAPKPQQVTSRYFPRAICEEFTTANLDGISKKIKEFNSSIEGGHRLEEAELRNLDRVTQALANIKTSSLTKKDLELIMKLVKWPKNLVFPCLDLYRVALLNNSSQELFKGSDHGAEHIAYICGLVENNPNENPILTTGLKVLCNMFVGNSSQYAIETRRELVLNAVLVNIENTNKTVRNGIITLMFNFSVRIAERNDPEGKIQILSAINDLLQNEADNENLLKMFTTVGNLVSGGGLKREVLANAIELGIPESVKGANCDGKALECKTDLLSMLR